MLRKKDWLTKGNIKNKFFHVEMREKNKEYLRFKHRRKYFKYAVMPMESLASLFIFQLMLKLVIQYIRDILKVRLI
jgi:hypothetical protein